MKICLFIFVPLDTHELTHRTYCVLTDFCSMMEEEAQQSDDKGASDALRPTDDSKRGKDDK